MKIGTLIFEIVIPTINMY